MVMLYLDVQEYISKKRLEKRADEQYDYTQVDAVFMPIFNRFVVDIAYLHQSVFDPDHVTAVNYASLGHTIAHEIFHGFDSKGVKYNGDGHLMRVLSEQSEQSFNSMTQCVVDEYSRFNMTDSDGKAYNIDGRQTILENLSDLGGMAAVYDAFMNDPDSKKPIPWTPKLKGLTNEQLFFVSFARLWCKAHTEDEFLQPFDDVHSPNRFRILGVLRNFVPFRNAFKCPVNSEYAPEKHCNVYTPQ
uniref:Peptidase_M13 domain-containing protein n=1 Tax=Panagrellus redivivus TaxID=6233 RepID=A0A7E4V9D5_PANRE